MPLLDNNGRLFGKFNILDAGITALLLLAILGVVLVQSNMHATSNAMIEGESDIDIKVMFRIRSNNPALLKKGDVTNISVRNQPRGEVKVVDVKQLPAEVMLSVNGKPEAVVDATEINVQDYWVTLRDHATISKEGYVAEGVKIKTGLPINLEGFDYMVHGSIVEVVPVASETPVKPEGE
jgi:Domain of unknown function (DUF4330)